MNTATVQHQHVNRYGAAPTGWAVKRLDGVAINHDRKRRPLSKMQRQERPGPYPYYGAAKVFDFIDDYIFDGTYCLIAEDGSVITPEGYPVMQLAKGKFWANNHTHILEGRSPVTTRYLFYYLSGFDISGYITGAAQPKITQSNLNRIPVLVPPTQTLNKITAILSAYDDLIENNLRRIAILEEMAQGVYREWFVKFRFPGHQNVTLVDSPLGEIPRGWEVKRLGDVARVNVASIREGNAPQIIQYIDIASVSPGRIEKIEELFFDKAPSRARRIVRHGDIIWSCVRPNRKSYSLILDPPPNLIVSTGFAVIGAREVPFTYLYQAVTTDGFVGYLTNRATGAAYPAVSANDFNNAEILVPPKPLLDRFHEIIESQMMQKQSFLRRNEILRGTRDLLLPRVISGELDVSDLDIGIGEEAA